MSREFVLKKDFMLDEQCCLCESRLISEPCAAIHGTGHTLSETDAHTTLFHSSRIYLILSGHWRQYTSNNPISNTLYQKRWMHYNHRM